MSSLRDNPGLFIGLMAIGFVVGTFGHVYKNNFAVGTGIFLVFVSTVLLPGLVYFTD